MGRSVPQSMRPCDAPARREARATLDAPLMRSLELVLPCPLPANAPATLSRLLARSRATRTPSEGTDATILQAFGVERQRDWPVAPFTWLGDGGAATSGYWLRADPVHLRAERDALVLVDAQRLSLDDRVAHGLVAALNAHFAQDGFQFHAPAPDRWYISLPAAPALTTTPLHVASGRSIDPLLPQGDDARSWHGRMNEIQMLLHEHPINEAREAAGLSPINSVWIWGGGSMPSVEANRFDTVWGNLPLLRGLARAAHVADNPEPATADEWLAQANASAHLVALSLTVASSTDALERNWFAPLWTALRERQLEMLGLSTEHEDERVRFAVAAADLWKFWRRRPAS